MLEALSRSRFGMHTAVGIGRTVPRAFADRLVAFAADCITANPDSPIMRASRSNQWVISGGTLSRVELDEAVVENVRYMARFLYDLYHVLGKDEAEKAVVVRDDFVRRFVEREISGKRPFIYTGVHLGNFDIMGRVLGHEGWRMQVLSVAEPHEGYQWQNEWRTKAGFDLTPVSVESLKSATRRLESGRSILTGLDRPLPKPDKVMPHFFGRTAPMPLLHVRLAMRTGAPVVVCGSRLDADGRYHLLASDPIEMVGEKPTPDALMENAERCLAPVERWIAEAPGQWAMPHLVWPDVIVPD